MRIIYFFLIFMTSLFSTAAPQMNVFQARGLRKGKCYQEIASLNCKETCTLDLFPTTQAQITLYVNDISKKDRMTMGHLFEVRFKVLNKEANEIKTLSIDSALTRDSFSAIQLSDGMVIPKSCK
ncbi:MAG TPA: hypothetical protein VIG33_16120 [Pseudobdellovibrionaceae bacterium]